MSPASVVHTTLSTRAVAAFVQSAFELPGSPTVRLVNRGFNDIYEIATSPPLFLRIGRQARRSVAEAEAEGRALAEAHDAGVPVAIALRGRDGRFGQRVAAPEGDRAALLFAEAPGADAEDTPAHAWAQGRSLARLHGVRLSDVTAASLRRLDLVTMIEEPTARAVALLHDRPALVASVERVAAGVTRYVEGMQRDLSVGLCHGDCHGYNAIIEGDVATLFDFDDGGVGWQVYDIATFLRTREFQPSTCRELCSSFIAGYRSLRALPAADREALEAMAMVRELWTYGAHAEGAEHWGDRWFHSIWIERRIEALAARFDRLAGLRLV
jgi:Ser/Thr protein kinase RdoA (MazF antagonist)